MKILWIASILCQCGFASYRAFALKVTHYTAAGRIDRVERVVSNLDANQYQGYYPATSAEMLDTWYCPGDTSGKEYCPWPVATPTRGLSSVEPKRSPIH